MILSNRGTWSPIFNKNNTNICHTRSISNIRNILESYQKSESYIIKEYLVFAKKYVNTNVQFLRTNLKQWLLFQIGHGFLMIFLPRLMDLLFQIWYSYYMLGNLILYQRILLSSPVDDMGVFKLEDGSIGKHFVPDPSHKPSISCNLDTPKFKGYSPY